MQFSCAQVLPSPEPDRPSPAAADPAKLLNSDTDGEAEAPQPNSSRRRSRRAVSGSAGGGRKRRRKGDGGARSDAADDDDSSGDGGEATDAATIRAAGAALASTPATSVDGDRWVSCAGLLSDVGR